MCRSTFLFSQSLYFSPFIYKKKSALTSVGIKSEVAEGIPEMMPVCARQFFGYMHVILSKCKII
jgi:hypothetical protein